MRTTERGSCNHDGGSITRFPRWTPSLARIALFFWTISQFKSSNVLGIRRAKSLMGRGRWTTRLTVEQSYALDIGQLVRAGVFDADPRSLCAFTWNDSAGMPISSVTFRVFPDRTGALAVHFYHPVPTTPSRPGWIQQQIVQITTTKCNFGGVRRWFRCSLIRDGYPCKRRVRVLYSTPVDRLFGCRECHNLTYESTQRHDKRIDWLLKLPAAEFTLILESGTHRQKLLAIRASTALLLRMQKKARRFSKRCHNSTGLAFRVKNAI